MITPSWSVVVLFLGLVLLAGCAGPGPQRPVPVATEAQLDKERAHLQQTFFTDPCMRKLRQSAPELKPGAAQQGGKTLYAVEYPPNSALRDGLAYQLHVKEQGRMAYLYISDGTAGSYRIHGPLPLWNCLQVQIP